MKICRSGCWQAERMWKLCVCCCYAGSARMLMSGWMTSLSPKSTTLIAQVLYVSSSDLLSIPSCSLSVLLIYLLIMNWPTYSEVFMSLLKISPFHTLQKIASSLQVNHYEKLVTNLTDILRSLYWIVTAPKMWVGWFKSIMTYFIWRSKRMAFYVAF